VYLYGAVRYVRCIRITAEFESKVALLKRLSLLGIGIVETDVAQVPAASQLEADESMLKELREQWIAGESVSVC
jgi:hypothetical protein